MEFFSRYPSPLGEILLAADEGGLIGLWLEGQSHDPLTQEKELPIFTETKRWLDIYFSGQEPDFTPPLHFLGTPFQKQVWDILLRIPYGQTVTYGHIAKSFGRMSAQAVGGAVGRNRISIIVPCHRVVGANGSLTGYAGGLDKKSALLQLERIL